MKISWIKVSRINEYLKRTRNGISSDNLPKGFNIGGVIITGQTSQK